MDASLVACVIVDDLNLIGLGTREEVNEALLEAEPYYLKIGWTAQESKKEDAQLTGRKVTGVMVDGESRTLHPPREKLEDCARVVLSLVRERFVSVAAVDRVAHVLGW